MKTLKTNKNKMDKLGYNNNKIKLLRAIPLKNLPRKNNPDIVVIMS